MAGERIKYSDLLVEWLADEGYTHCFFVAGGASMHLLDGVRKRMTCIPTVHEVAAGIAAEYYNESGAEGKAFVLVTAGPGITNTFTAIGGAWLESRELLVLGGQVKTADLARGEVRQRGIQEIDGRSMAEPVTVASVRLEEPAPRHEIEALVRRGATPRKGPVFIEVCLDVQGAPVLREELEGATVPASAVPALPTATDDQVAAIRELIAEAERPVLLIGGGVSREVATAAAPLLRAAGIPTMTTWNGIDRVGSDEPFYFGRPNFFGQRSANVIQQQADLLVAVGTRLGLQQTGFNWQEYVPLGRVVQVDVDAAELEKGHPRVDLAVQADADDILPRLLTDVETQDLSEWTEFCREVRALLPLSDPLKEHAPGYLDPYDWMLDLADLCTPDDVFIPCSSGGTYTCSMQAFQQKLGQVIVSDKGAASMGYGLSGAIGAALARPERRTVMVEGDGGFVQNLQELATVVVNDLNLKVIVVANEGYASIRTTQRNYFGGQYLGCDTRTGLGFPDWLKLFDAYGIPAMELTEGWSDDARFRDLFEGRGPAAFVLPVDPEQTYLPKISSRVTATGSMESNPLHLMDPELPPELAARVFRYLEVPASPATR
jgi:acetolactate synthase I/II/III large subunit